jgi:phosphate transport system permease protein
MLERLKTPWPDRRAERLLGAVSLLVGAAIVAMIVFVAARAWPIFEHDGIGWLFSGKGLEDEVTRMNAAAVKPPPSAYTLHAWPLVYDTLLSTAVALVLGLALALLASVFIVELAPARVKGLMIPVVRLLASVPSVIYGLIGILVLVPFVGNHLISDQERRSVLGVAQLTGQGLLVVTLILTIMITPIMIALICDALAAVPRAWREGAIALGLNPLRAVRAVTLKAIRPAIVAAAVLATARALGEAVVVAMVSGGKDFAPNLSHGVAIFLFEPLRTFASFVLEYHEGIGSPPLKAAVYALAFLLLFSAFALSLGGYLVKLPLRRYQTRG